MRPLVSEVIEKYKNNLYAGFGISTTKYPDPDENR